MRGRRFAHLAIILALSAAGLSVLAQQAPENKPNSESQAQDSVTNYHSHIFGISLDESSRPNPIGFSAQSVERGAKLYEKQCSMCHGKSGKGDGALARKMKVHMPDFTNPETLKKWTDGEIFAIQSRDFPVMPEQNYRRDNPKWDIVNFLRSISAGASGKDGKREHRANVKSPRN